MAIVRIEGDTAYVRGARRLRGRVVAPGDKSISHRAIMLNSLARGEARVSNFLMGADCLSTIACFRAMGVDIQQPGAGVVLVRGRDLRGLEEPSGVLDAGNSGTTARLISGVLAGQAFFSVLTGDDSLRSRPMGRVIQPLRLMGARILARGGDTLLPMAIRGGELRGIDYTLPVASAQLKSCLLLAGLFATGPITLVEPAPSRDHTERMLRSMGCAVTSHVLPDGRNAIRLEPPASALSARDVPVPADISSAAFFLCAALAHPDAEVLLPDVGVNPTRAGLPDVLREMGAAVPFENERDVAGEPVADLAIRTARLRGVRAGGADIPRLVDEVPVLAVVATQAEGITEITDAAELRVKESDRLSAVTQELRKMGAEIEERPDGLLINGPTRLRGAEVESHADHRLAMSLAVAALLAEGETIIRGAGSVVISYPRFWEDLTAIAE